MIAAPRFSGIHMQAHSSQGIRDRIKLATRRVILPQPAGMAWSMSHCGRVYAYSEGQRDDGTPAPYQCGDILWVRETWRPMEDNNGPYIEYRAGGIWQPDEDLWKGEINAIINWDKNDKPMKRWRSPRFMYRWAAQHWLSVTSVHHERLHDITDEEALLEGCQGREVFDGPGEGYLLSPRDVFHQSWNLINAGRGFGWDTNPWVWVIKYDIVSRPETAVLFELMEKSSKKEAVAQ